MNPISTLRSFNPPSRPLLNQSTATTGHTQASFLSTVEQTVVQPHFGETSQKTMERKLGWVLQGLKWPSGTVYEKEKYDTGRINAFRFYEYLHDKDRSFTKAETVEILFLLADPSHGVLGRFFTQGPIAAVQAFIKPPLIERARLGYAPEEEYLDAYSNYIQSKNIAKPEVLEQYADRLLKAIRFRPVGSALNHSLTNLIQDYGTLFSYNTTNQRLA